jgi:RNA recognition motif-containing protein
MNIFVANLPYQVTNDQLKTLFEKYGEVSSVKVIVDKLKGRSKGYGFVEMPADKEALKAIDSLNGLELEGRAIAVKKSESGPNR